ncbi:hypothetical protein [Polaromonas sp.]|uniref:hypothetical protein n=1 Tax=Polaromonas sp. TaxID=1869339 RepID=UPI001DEBA4CA|nr:hypothetical protein [Polaromonas sp.]MBT9476086.1 hypothetical protein [Polaromonas sp.]
MIPHLCAADFWADVAAEKVQARGLGVGRLAVSLLDALQLLDRVTFENRLRLEVSTWPG